MSKRNLRSFRFERLENRRLLAADFGAEMVECFPVPAEVCEAVSVTQDQTESEIDFDQTEIELGENTGDSIESDPVVEAPIENSPIENSPIENGPADDGPVEDTQGNDATEDQSETTEETEPESEIESEAAVLNELRDPVLGTSGYFGVLDASSPTKTMIFTPTDTGTIDVVVTTSFGDSETVLDVVNSNGDTIVSTTTEDLDGFQKVTFDAVEGETYEVTVSSDETGEGNFMMTVSFEETPPGPVDLHANEMGESSTQLEFVDDSASMSGELEVAGDTDTFRFTAEDSGKMRISLSELLDTNATELNISIHDSSGEMIARGLTNEMVMVSFDVIADAEYFIAVEATDEQTGAYELAMDLESTAPTAEATVDFHANAIGEDGTLLEWVSNEGQPDSISVSSELETADDKDAFRFNSPGEGEITLDLNVLSDNHSSDVSVAIYSNLGELIEIVDLSSSETTDVGVGQVDIIESNMAQSEAVENETTISVEAEILATDNESEAAQVAADEANQDVIGETPNIVVENDSLIVDGTTNEEVTIRFDTTSGVEYHVLVDSLNDVPAVYNLTGSFIPAESVLDIVENENPIDDESVNSLIGDLSENEQDELDEVVDTVVDDGTSDATNDEMIVCFDDQADELSRVDEIFQDLESQFENLFEQNDRQLGDRGGNPFGRWI
ncbi:MAG: hypothetical protein AB8B55_24640 [Mariniblastus sp.]